MTGRYRVEIEDAATRQLARLPQAAQARIKQRVTALADNPRPPGVKKLVGTANAWRIRVGDYRVIYTVHDDVLVIVVVKIGHRKEVYVRIGTGPASTAPNVCSPGPGGLIVDRSLAPPKIMRGRVRSVKSSDRSTT